LRSKHKASRECCQARGTKVRIIHYREGQYPSCSLRDYLTLYQTRRQNLLQERGSFDQGYLASVATTWSFSCEKVRQAQPAATELLNFCAFLAPDAIPEAIITEGAPYLGDILAPVVADPIQLDLACKEVLKYSLFQRDLDTGTLTIYRLVQAVLQDNLPTEIKKKWKQRAVLAVNAAFPLVEHQTWPQCDRLLPHALLCAELIAQEQMTLPQAVRLLDRAGQYLDDRARYAEAEPLYVRALAICEQQSGAEHPSTATSLNNLANLYSCQEKYSEAEPLYQQALSIDTAVYGEQTSSRRVYKSWQLR
jgi:tetratricopeptide (TPR) repeat protein